MTATFTVTTGPIPNVISLSLYPAPAATSTLPSTRDLFWEWLVENFTRHEQVEQKEDARGWSPAILQEGTTRADANVEAISCAVLDFDHTTTKDRAETRRHLKALNLAHVIYSTFQSTREAPRFRVIIPFVTPFLIGEDWAQGKREWERFYGQLRELFPGSDSSTHEPSRFYYWPSSAEDPEAFRLTGGGTTFAYTSEGEALDWRGWVDGIEIITIAPVQNGHVTPQKPVPDHRPLGTTALRFFIEGEDGRERTQRDAALGAARDCWRAGKSEAEAIELVGQGIHNSPTLKADDPWTDRDVIRLVHSIYTSEPTPLNPTATLTLHGQPSDAVNKAEEILSDAKHHLTDLGNARRLVRLYGAQMRYCERLGGWYVYDGIRWQPDETKAVERLARDMLPTIYNEAADATFEERKAIAKWALTSESRSHLDAMVALAAAEPGIAVGPAQFDQDPWLLNTQNGTLDLRTHELRPHAPSDYLTKCVATLYDPEATCPVWDAFLVRILPDHEVRKFVQKVAGYSLTGSTRERVFLILYGGGANGKSTLLDTLRTLLDGYAMQTPTETLMVRRDSGIPNDIARLRGARFVSAVEGEEGKYLAESLIKQFTGGVDTLTARFLHAEFFEFRPEFKIWLATNHKPGIKGTDKAIWDRIRLIPFEVRIPEDERDMDLSHKLLAELPGILRWAVDGCPLWQKEGLAIPEKVRVATNDYRVDMDLLGAFIQDCCDEDPQLFTLRSALYQGYVSWCEKNGEKPLSQKALAPRLLERGYIGERAHAGRLWRGVGLRITGGIHTAEE